MFTDEMELACRAVYRAGEYLRNADRDGVESYNNRDIKLKADKCAEKILLDALSDKYPIIAEESGVSGRIEADSLYWIVDPLDGTMNFHRGITQCCISVALWKGESPVLGVIYDFNADDLFTGQTGNEAHLNGRKISTGSLSARSEAILATGIPTQMNLGPDHWPQFGRVLGQFKKVRMIGSAALSLAYVAMGKFDAYYEIDIKIWDVAAGLAILSAAGGSWSCIKGEEKYNVTIAAGSNRQMIPD